MSMSSVYPWRQQKSNVAPTLSYKNLNKPLIAPKGKRWNYDPTKNEWSLVSSSTYANTTAVCVAKVTTVVEQQDENNDDNDGNHNDVDVMVDAVVIENEEGDNNKIINIEKEEEQDDNDDDINYNPFIEHFIEPHSETFQGLCLKYKVKPLEVRRANGGFSGTNLNLIPNPLLIPKNEHNTTTGTSTTKGKNDKKKNKELESIDIDTITTVDAVPIVSANNSSSNIIDAGTATTAATKTTTYKNLTENDVIDILLKECPGANRDDAVYHLSNSKWDFPTAVEKTKIAIVLKLNRGMYPTEAKAYLMLNDWNVQDALKDAKHDDDHKDEARYVFE